MKFLSLIKISENIGTPPPQSLFDAMDVLISKQTASGALIDTGGLRPTKEGARVRIQGDKIKVTDGPFTEAKEVVGGYAILSAASRDEAIDLAREFVQLHIDHWPGIEFECEVRQIEQ